MKDPWNYERWTPEERVERVIRLSTTCNLLEILRYVEDLHPQVPRARVCELYFDQRYRLERSLPR
jgi:hypothetical protein